MKEQEFYKVLNDLLSIEFDEYNCTTYEFDERAFTDIIMVLERVYAYVSFKNELPVDKCIELTSYSYRSYDFNDVSRIDLPKFVKDVYSVIDYLNSSVNYYDEDGWRGRMCWEWEING